MYIFNCGSIDHPAGQVYSVDLHPSGRLLATAGFNEKGKGCLIVWDLSSLIGNSSYLAKGIKSEKTAEKATSKRLKLDEKSHLKRQNCVRWSRIDDGRYLVLTGDNPIVHLYEPLYDMENNSFELRDACQLVGHKMEVMHAEFNRDGKLLATCSLDTSIIVWNMRDLSKPMRILTAEDGGHTDMVRGLVWDPLERFLITQSSDQTIKVWRVGNWECEQTIKGFANPSKFYSRLDWTADGSMLVAPCSSNTGFNTAKIVLRKQWMPELDLVGFEGTTSCVRGSARCSYIDMDGKTVVGSLVAVGSSDRSVSVWMLPIYQRPICVIQEILPEEILDLSWNDEKLIVCGINGSIRCLVFEESETGRFLSDREMALQYSKTFSYIPSIYRSSHEDAENYNITLPSDVKDIWEQFEDVTDEMVERSKECTLHLLPHNLTRSCQQCLATIKTKRERFPSPEVEVIGN
ncbi:unnamed protein product [Bursaphelenchus xylophilus]|uniref:(pine wood nematode) hypothetical protein n=1 Tax=Bursaphelenchus xylophilus TaxID=6326 RepID=A0A1I7RRK3_BURXY|nr:unnamed protein product [Bursaphelenchus xylophilus]CAG9131086.1 unnamed protein product [Bursaphelenchus xylophilus]